MKINSYSILAVGSVWLFGVIISALVLDARSGDALALSKAVNQPSPALLGEFSLTNNQSRIVSARPLLRDVPEAVKNLALDDNSFTTKVESDNASSIVITKPQDSIQSQLPTRLNSQQPLLPSSSQFVSESGSSRQSLSPTLIVYPDELVFEFSVKIADEKNIKRSMVRLLLSDDPYREQDWLSHKALSLKNKPYFYKRILDHKQRPMRYPASVYRYVDYLLEDAVVEHRGKEGDFILFHIPVVQRNMSEDVNKYNYIVSNYAGKFKVSPDLVFAIMEVESGFNPKAVSRSNALGLMQLKADAAGKDVYQLIDNKTGMPSKSELFDAENNIRMGTAYMGLLKHEYLAGVRNERSKEMLLISSYNGGLTTVLKLFGETPEKSIKRINQLHPRQIYRSLRYKHASDETRNYLDKVLKTKSKYSEMLDLNV